MFIEVKDLHKSYGSKNNRFEALRGISFSIKQGESIAILGKSGSGKSTLMHILAGLDSSTSGEVLLEGKNLGKMGEKQLAKIRNEKFGFVFQQFFLQPNMSVLENVALPLKIQGVGKKKREQIAAGELEKVELLDKSQSKANDLSGGQKQRTAIARAIVSSPAVIFADEPTGNLDAETGENIINLLFSLQKETNATLIIVTHDQDLANRCNRILHIKDGILQ